MPPHPNWTFDFSQLWIALLVIGAMWGAWWWLSRRKK
jgi:hypothetical protein